MAEFSNLGNVLYRADIQMGSYSKIKPDSMPNDELKKITTSLKSTHKDILKEIKRQPLPEFDPTAINQIIKKINGLTRKSKEPSTPTRKIFNEALRDLKTTLHSLKKLKQIEVRTPVKIEGISQQGLKHLYKDLNRHVVSAGKAVALMREMSENKTQIPDAQLNEMTMVLKKAHVALAKGVAMQGTLKLINLPGIKKGVIEKILEDIPFILLKDINSQARVGIAARMQATSFRSSLKEFKSLLARVLKMLKQSRGGQAASVEQDSQK